MRYVLLSVGALATCAATAFVVPGCSDHGPDAGSATTQEASPTRIATGGTAAPSAMRRQQVGGFIGTYDPTTKTMVFTPKPTVYAVNSRITPESVDGLTDVQSTSGHTNNTVDLKTNGTCTDTPGTGAANTGSFSCSVTLRSWFTAQTLTNPYVQITAIYGADGGATAAGFHNASNSDATNTLGLSNTNGLWGYTNSSESANAISGVLTPQSLGFNTGTRTWTFYNADDAVISYDIAVFASLDFSSYTLGKANADTISAGYQNACSDGTVLATTAKTGVTLPFDFTLYATNGTTLAVDQVGELVFGSKTSLNTSTTSINLPSASAPEPVFFPFWDDTLGDSNDASADEGLICQETFGTAPNRKYIIEWQNFDFGSAVKGPTGKVDGANKGAVLDYEVWLYEGTSEIDVIYQTMQGPTSGGGVGDNRETGLEATIGMQNDTATAATVQYHTTAVSTCAASNNTYTSGTTASCATLVGYYPVP